MMTKETTHLRVYFLNDGTDEIFNTNVEEYPLSVLKELGPRKFFYEKICGTLKEWFHYESDHPDDDVFDYSDPEKYKDWYAYFFEPIDEPSLDGMFDNQHVIPEEFFVCSDRFIEALDFVYHHVGPEPDYGCMRRQ